MTPPTPNPDTNILDVLIIGAGQAGLAMSAHLRDPHAIPHLLVERADRVAARWHTERWDSLVQNGPCTHDRFPVFAFPCSEAEPEAEQERGGGGGGGGGDGGPDVFATRDQVVAYFDAFARQIAAPVRLGVNIVRLTQSTAAHKEGGLLFRAETAQGEVLTARQVVVATGSFQRPAIPPVLPPGSAATAATTTRADLFQVHASQYKNPAQLPPGAVLVVGAGSSGAQIADELLRTGGRRVYLSVGRHQRPPRRYRGKDSSWWLQKLGKWDLQTSATDSDNSKGGSSGSKHVAIAVSGYGGGRTIDYREMASRGLHLVGRLEGFDEPTRTLKFAPDLRANIEAGDRDYFSVLREADAWVAREEGGLAQQDLPDDPAAHRVLPDPPCLTHPLLELALARREEGEGEEGAGGVASIVWATGYARDFDWIQIPRAVEQATQRPVHREGVSTCVPGLYFVGLPFLRNRASSFIFGVWNDAEYVAERVAQDRAKMLGQR